MLKLLAEQGLMKGNTISIDGTTLEANAALRSLVHRETGEAYNDFLKKLAAESGIETPTREQLAKLDRKRPRKGSNEEWENPEDPDSRIMKMKDGRTHLAHKAEHAVDWRQARWWRWFCIRRLQAIRRQCSTRFAKQARNLRGGGGYACFRSQPRRPCRTGSGQGLSQQ